MYSFWESYEARFPFHTPRAVLWNIKTLGFGCWVKCLMGNTVVAASERYAAVAMAARGRNEVGAQVRLAPRHSR